MNRYLICCNGKTEWRTCTKEAICYLCQKIADEYNSIVEVERFRGMDINYQQFYPKEWFAI